MKKINIYKVSLLAPVVLSIIYLIIYLITGQVGAVDTTAFADFPKGYYVFNHKLPFAVSRLWDVPVSYVYLLLVLFMARDEGKEGSFVLSLLVFLVSMFFAFGLHFILGLTFAMLSFFPSGMATGSMKGATVVSAIICLATVVFLGLQAGFGPGLTVGMGLATILILSIAVVIAAACFVWKVLSKFFLYIYRWMFAVNADV